MKFFKKLGIPLFGFIFFFIVQSMGFVGESALTFFVVILFILTIAIYYHKKELLLFFVGCIFGFIIEIGLRYFGYQQVWNNASLLGVPYWLPLIWGYGFVVITRLGIYLEFPKKLIK